MKSIIYLKGFQVAPSHRWTYLCIASLLSERGKISTEELLKHVPEARLLESIFEVKNDVWRFPKSWCIAEPRSKADIPSLDEVADYFCENDSSEIEAQKFYDYFSSNGWKVGGKAVMKDWKAACRNWIRNNQTKQDKENANKKIGSRISRNDAHDLVRQVEAITKASGASEAGANN